LITMLFGTTTMCSTFASSVFSSASPYISEQFKVGRQVTVLGVSLFIAGYIFGPLLWSSLSEQYGRKGTILVPVFLFMCLTAMTATAKDLQVRAELGRVAVTLRKDKLTIFALLPRHRDCTLLGSSAASWPVARSQ
jgi:MFS family permease